MGEATIICLAKSRKNGRCCVAGRLFDGTAVGPWIRPVATPEGGAVGGWQTCCTDGAETDVGEIVTVPLRGPCPYGHQPENHLLDTSRRWRRLGRASWTLLYVAQDTTDDSFWDDHGHSTYGSCDRIPELLARSADGSLRLVYLTGMRLSVQHEPSMYHPPRRTIRAEFQINGTQFRLGVTDPWVEDRLRNQADGVYEIGMAMICVSLGEIYNGYAYRLVAAVIVPSRCEDDS